MPSSPVIAVELPRFYLGKWVSAAVISEILIVQEYLSAFYSPNDHAMKDARSVQSCKSGHAAKAILQKDFRQLIYKWTSPIAGETSGGWAFRPLPHSCGSQVPSDFILESLRIGGRPFVNQ